MGPEVVWDSQVGKASERGRRKKEKKNPGDAVVAWENKQLSGQLKRETALGRQVRSRPADEPAEPGRTNHRLWIREYGVRFFQVVGGVNAICRVVGCHSNGSWATPFSTRVQFWRVQRLAGRRDGGNSRNSFISFFLFNSISFNFMTVIVQH